jgi:hypothetical protein
LVALGFLANPPVAQAQVINCGSSGARGALVVPAAQTLTLDVPDDGVFHYTTINVAGTLLFNRNLRFNPPVFLLATGDVTIPSGGTIRANGTNGTTVVGGLGGPGGFDGGAPGIAGGVPGSGHGPGAGGAGIGALLGGNGAYGGSPPNTNFATDGVTYGSPLLVPIAGGSGGGGDTTVGGGGGGGAILICSPTQIVVNGFLEAIGGSYSTSSNGSGGGVRLVSPAVRGTGWIYVYGGTGYGGHGRIRIDLIDRSGLTINYNPASALSVGSLMVVFPGTVPRLDIVDVAGNGIPPGTPSPLVFTLPFGAPASQAITVRATGFAGIVPIAVVVTPDSGDRIVVNTEIDGDQVPAQTTVNVDLPQNITVRVHAWTR